MRGAGREKKHSVNSLCINNTHACTYARTQTHTQTMPYLLVHVTLQLIQLPQVFPNFLKHTLVFLQRLLAGSVPLHPIEGLQHFHSEGTVLVRKVKEVYQNIQVLLGKWTNMSLVRTLNVCSRGTCFIFPGVSPLIFTCQFHGTVTLIFICYRGNYAGPLSSSSAHSNGRSHEWRWLRQAIIKTFTRELHF